VDPANDHRFNHRAICVCSNFLSRQQIRSFNHRTITAALEEKEITRACPSCVRFDLSAPFDGINAQHGRPVLRFPQPIGTGKLEGLTDLVAPPVF
jgi:hypothetical protein